MLLLGLSFLGLEIADWVGWMWGQWDKLCPLGSWKGSIWLSGAVTEQCEL